MLFYDTTPLLRILFVLMSVVFGCVQIYTGQRILRKKASFFDKPVSDDKFNQKLGLAYLVGDIGCILIATSVFFSSIWLFYIGAAPFILSLSYTKYRIGEK